MDNYSVNTFLTGMDQDTSISKYKPTSYYSANNMRLTTRDGVSLGTIENEKGNSTSFKFPNIGIVRLNIAGIGTWGGTLTFATVTITIGTAINISGLGKYVADYLATPAGGSVVWDATETQPDPYYSAYTDGTIRVVQHGLTVSFIGLGDVTVTNTSGTLHTTYDNLAVVKSYTNTSGHTIIGYTNIRDRLILFTANKDTTTETPTNDYGAIWQVQYNSNNEVIGLTGSGYLVTGTHLLYAGLLNFSMAYSISATSFHINEYVGSVYWTDNYNNLRHANVYDKFLLSASILELEVVPTVEFSKPLVTELYQGGAYKSGVVMYCYQYYNKYSSESVISPLSNKVCLTTSSESESNSSYYWGDPIDTNTGKVVRIVIDNLNINFDYIRLFAIYYASINDTPEILLVADRRIRNLSTLDIVDDGYSYLGKSTYMELRNYEKMVFACKDLTIKDNRLIIGNILERNFDVTYDCRAYRHAPSSTSFYVDGVAQSSFSAVGEFDDCIPGVHDTYKYQQSSTVLGGTGPNIKYTFGTQQIVLDQGGGYYELGSPKTTQAWSSSLGSGFVDNYYYGNYASPINSGQIVGYKRGEIYRFGCVFISSRGKRSPVKWIADIKMPDINETTSTIDVVSNVGQIVKTPEIDMAWLYPWVQVNVALGYDSAMYMTLVVDGASTIFHVNLENALQVSLYDDLTGKWNELARLFLEIIEAKYPFITVDNEYNSVTGKGIYKLTSSIPGATITVASCSIQYYTDTGALFSTLTPFIQIQTSGTTTSSVSTYTPIYQFVNGQTVGNIIYPTFQFTSALPTDDLGATCSYEIVRVKRTDKDISRLGQGLLLPTVEENTSGAIHPIPSFGLNPDKTGGYSNHSASAKELITTKYVNFISPEIIFRKKLITNSDSVSIVGMCPMESSAIGPLKFQSYVPVTTPITGAIIEEGITEAVNSTAGTDIKGTIPRYSLGTKTVTNVFMGREDKSYTALAGSSTYILLDDELSIPSTYTTTDNYVAYAEITRPVASPYGGNTYYDRVNNEYIGTGAFSSIQGSYVPVFGGDTYIAYFDYLRAMWSDREWAGGENGEFYQILFFPVETMINLDMRFDKCFSKISKARSGSGVDRTRSGNRTTYAGSRSGGTGITDNSTGFLSSIIHGLTGMGPDPANWTGSHRNWSRTDGLSAGAANNAKYLQETAGDYSGMVGGELNYLQSYDLYLENEVYSKEYDFFTYVPKIFEDELVYRKDCEIMISEEYNRNEKIDNFLKFLPNNRQTLNSIYGSINALINYNNNVFIFQDKAIVNQPINERAMLQDPSGSNLILGTGDILGRAQYVSTGTGSQNKLSVISAKTGLYYYDSINRSLYRLGNGNTDVSSIKGLSSFFSTNHDPDTRDDQPLLGNGIHGIYDEINNRILLTHLGDTDYTIGYNEKIDCFESLYDYKPYIYAKTFDNKILSCVPSQLYHVCLHDSGNYGQYYGTYYDSSVTLLSSKDANVNKIFTNIEFYTKVSATTPVAISAALDTETINKARFYNDYQDTTLKTVVANMDPTASQFRIQRSLRKWRMKVPTILVSGRYTRLSSTHMFTDLYFTNNANKKFYLDDVVTYYTPAQY